MAHKQSPFLPDALRHHAHPEVEAALVRIAPAWGFRAYWLVFFVLACSALAATLVEVDQHLAAPAIVRAVGSRSASAGGNATVIEVLARTGERVRSGDIIMRLRDEQISADAQRSRVAAGAALFLPQSNSSTSAGKKQEDAKSIDYLVRAPIAGVVEKLDVGAGQYVHAGDRLLTVVPEETLYRMTAAIAASVRADIKIGAPLRFAYGSRASNLVVTAVEPDLRDGPEVGKIFNSQALAGAFDGQLAALVDAALPTPEHDAPPGANAFFSGLHGTAQIRIARRSLWRALLASP